MTEEMRYEETGRIGDVELRHYPEVVVAGISGFTEDVAFGYLFRYISGENTGRRKIPMTAPVISDESTMSFVMPRGYSLEELPEPVDRNIHLEEIPSRQVAVIRFSGVADQRSVTEMTARLLKTLEEHHLRVVGTPFLLRYNSPFVPGFLRRNEVGVEIQQDKR